MRSKTRKTECECFRSDGVLEKVPVKGGRRSGLRVGVMMKIS
jgi:hypothetical protein